MRRGVGTSRTPSQRGGIAVEPLEARTMLSAAEVLEWNFATLADGSPAANGAGINAGGDFFPSNFKDDASTVGGGQSLSGLGQHGRYVVGATVPNPPSPLPNGWDGAAVRFNGENYVRLADDALAFSGSFSAWARIYREGTNPANSTFDYIFGGAQPNNNGWGVYLNHANFNLDVNLGGELATAGTQWGVFNGAGPVIADQTWYDIGLVYSGTPADGIDDSLKVFVNGQLVQTFTGDAGFLPKPFGFSFAIGMDTFGNEGFKGLYERVVLWNGAIDDATMASLTAGDPPPVEESYGLDFDGADEPFYTTPNVGATLTLAQVNAILVGTEIPLTVGAHAADWRLRDANGGDHFLLGSQSAAGADFFANFTGAVGTTHVALNVGYFTSSAAATVTAYAEPVTDSSNAGIAALTPVGSQTLVIDGSSTQFFNFNFELPDAARSIVLEISGNSTGPAINRLEWGPDTDPPPPPPMPPRPTEVGEWHQFRGDRLLSGRAELTGNVTSPEILWSQFIGARESWTALTLNSGATSDFALPLANLGMSNVERNAWKVGGPFYDLNGTGGLAPIAPWIYYKYGDFLPATPGIERLEVSAIPGNANGDGVARLYRREGAGWVQLWQSQTIPVMQLGPNLIVDDLDNDGQLEFAVTAWYDVWVFDLLTGAYEDNASFNPPGAESGRPYGWHGAFNLGGDARKELVVLGDFENKIGVVGWDAGGNLVPLWSRLIESSPANKQTVHHPGVDPVQDIDGDGLPEIVTSIFNETGDGRWHVMAFNGMTGAVKLNLVDQYLTGLRDIDGDGVAELFVTAAPPTIGGRPPEAGEIKLLSFDGGALTTLWQQSGVGFQTGLVQDFPLNVSSGTGTGRLTLIAGPIDASHARPAFFTREIVDAGAGIVEITAWQADAGGAITALGTVVGPHINVIATRPSGAGGPDILVKSEIPGDVAASISISGFTAAAAYSARTGPPQTSAVVGRLEGDGKPTVIVQGAGEQLLALQTNTATGQVALDWIHAGRGEYTGGVQFTGQSEFGNVVLGDLLGTGELAVVAAARGPDGQARLVALAPDGSEIWAHDFDTFPGAPPVWNVGGLTTWKLGRFRDVGHDDVLVSLRRSTFHNDTYFLLDGLTGEVVWTREWGNTPGFGTHQRGAGGSQLAVFDWDGDGLDEAVTQYPDVFYVIDGDGDNVYDRNLILTVYGSMWPQGGIPIVADFLDNGTQTILHAGVQNISGSGNPYFFALTDKTGAPIWTVTGSFSQMSPAVLDMDGDGDLELFKDGVAYDAKTGAVLWTVATGTSANPAVSADIDGDGRDEAIFTVGGTLYIVGATSSAGTAGSIERVFSVGGTLGMPIVADSDGDGKIEILVVSTSGFIYSIGQPTIAGDTNFDGRVDIFDVAVVSANWGQRGPEGDANRDGVVDIFDVATVSANWSPSGAEAAVAESTASAAENLAADVALGETVDPPRDGDAAPTLRGAPSLADVLFSTQPRTLGLVADAAISDADTRDAARWSLPARAAPDAAISRAIDATEISAPDQKVESSWETVYNHARREAAHAAIDRALADASWIADAATLVQPLSLRSRFRTNG